HVPGERSRTGGSARASLQRRPRRSGERDRRQRGRLARRRSRPAGGRADREPRGLDRAPEIDQRARAPLPPPPLRRHVTLSFYIYYRVPAQNAERARAAVRALQRELAGSAGISGRVLRRRDDETTWMEIYENVQDGARFEALTNYRNPADKKTGAPSRGALVADFLTGKTSSQEYIRLVEKRAADYNGFSLLVGDSGSMFFFSNRGGRAARVAPGVHGLSNHLLDTPWPKVEKAKAGLLALPEGAFDFEAAFGLLNDTGRAAGSELPSTGVSPEVEE